MVNRSPTYCVWARGNLVISTQSLESAERIYEETCQKSLSGLGRVADTRVTLMQCFTLLREYNPPAFHAPCDDPVLTWLAILNHEYGCGVIVRAWYCDAKKTNGIAVRFDKTEDRYVALRFIIRGHTLRFLDRKRSLLKPVPAVKYSTVKQTVSVGHVSRAQFELASVCSDNPFVRAYLHDALGLIDTLRRRLHGILLNIA